MALSNDFYKCIPVHLRDDLYFQLKDWYHSQERQSYIEQHKEQTHEAEVLRARRMAARRKQALKNLITT